MSSSILLVKTTEPSLRDASCDPALVSSCSTAAETRTVTMPPVPPETSVGCGYNCSRHIYVEIRTRQYYEALTAEEREVIKTTYYQSYDYMTGLRTAASLGGTILLFSLFILYKMKCRHGRHRTKNIVLDGATALGDIDIEKDGGYFQNEKPTSAMATNNVGSRRSSRVVLTPEDFQFLTRQDHRRLSVATSSRSEGSRRSCGAIPPYGHSSYSIAFQNPRTPSLTTFPKQPRFTTDPDPAAMLLEVEPINIHIIQPTPNVSPCGSIRHLSEDVVALTGCRSKELSIPLLAIPKAHQAKTKARSKRSSLSKRDRRGLQEFPKAPIASTSSASTSGENLRPCSEDASELLFIDCSDSDAVSFCSDSDVFGPDHGSPVEHREFLPGASPSSARAQINSDDRETDEESSVSETRC